MQEAAGVRPLDPDQRRPAPDGRALPARPQAGVAGGRARREGRRRHGVATLPLELARSAARRACCSSWSTAERISCTIASRAGLVAALEQLLLGPRRQLEGPRDGVRERDALRRRGQRVVGQAGEGAEAGEHPVGQLGLGLTRVVGQRADPSREVEAPLRLLDQLDGLEAQDDDVQAPVLEPAHQGLEPRGAADVRRSGRAGLDDHERPVLEHAVRVELAVARLEEVEGHLLAGEDDQIQGEEPEIDEVAHAGKSSAPRGPRAQARRQAATAAAATSW